MTQNRSTRGLAVLVAGLLGIGSPAFASVIYNSIPAPLPGNVPSLGYQATQTSEFGDLISFAAGPRSLTDVTLVMSDWATESTYEAVGTSAGFNVPLTLNLYDVGPGNSVGSVISSQTINAFVPWRPEADPICRRHRMAGWKGELLERARVRGYLRLLGGPCAGQHHLRPRVQYRDVGIRTARRAGSVRLAQFRPRRRAADSGHQSIPRYRLLEYRDRCKLHRRWRWRRRNLPAGHYVEPLQRGDRVRRRSSSSGSPDTCALCRRFDRTRIQQPQEEVSLESNAKTRFGGLFTSRAQPGPEGRAE